jgi:hypothetical protein
MLRWVFIFIFAAGIVLSYSYIYRSFLKSWRRRWSYRISRMKRRDEVSSLWERWILERGNRPRNEKIKSHLRKAGYGSKEDYVRFKKMEYGWPWMAVLAISVVHTVEVTYENRVLLDVPWKVYIFLLLSGWLLLHLTLRWKAKDRAIQIGMEIVRFSDRLLMGLSTKTSLYYSIKRASRTTKCLKPYLDLLLIEWSQENPKKAIRSLMERVATDEIIPLANAMLVIVDHPTKAEYLMEQQMKNIETIRDFAIKQRIRVKPLYFIVLVTIPFTAGMIALIAPWYSETVRQLESMF